jgi:hypothetical protein
MRRVDHLLPLPLPCVVGEPTAASRISPGSSPARSDASEGGAAAFYAADAEPDPDPEPEASAGRSTQMLLAMAAMGARGGPYGRPPWEQRDFPCPTGRCPGVAGSRGAGGNALGELGFFSKKGNN